ncbi:7683_t:CDS:1, partial [Acaulospora colombiana]
GPWSAPLIPNPEYQEEPLLHAYNTAYIGFDLWQVKSGTIFDNIIITDDIESANAFAEETFVKFREVEKEAKRKLDEKDNEPEDDDSKGKEDDDDSQSKDDDDDIIDLDVMVGDEGKVVVSEPDPNLDLKVDDKPKPEDVPSIVEQDEEKVSSETESKEPTGPSSVEKESVASEKAKEETKTTPSASPKKQEEKDEFDILFEDLEEESNSPKRDEL